MHFILDFLTAYRVDNWTPQLEESTVMLDIRKAFATWADYARLRFVNKPRGYLDDVDISISFGSGHHGDMYETQANDETLKF